MGLERTTLSLCHFVTIGLGGVGVKANLDNVTKYEVFFLKAFLMYFNTSYIFFVIMHILIKELICRLGVFHVHMWVLCKQNVGNYQSNNFSSPNFFLS